MTLTKTPFGSTYGQNSMRLDDRSWLLFIYLVRHIPGQAIARILIESDFVSNLNACFQDGEPALELLLTEPCGEDSVPPTSTSRMSKRKRDEDNISMAQRIQVQPPGQLFPPLMAASICAAIRHCVELSWTNVDKASSEHIKLALAASPPTAASATGHLLSRFAAMISQGTSAPFDGSALVDFGPGLLGLWECSIAEDASTSEGESDREFTIHCLSPCLAFLQALETSDLAVKYGRIVRNIERLIALHCILPLRAMFFAQKPSGMVDGGGQPSTIDLFPIVEGMAPLLFDIAVRTVPRNTVRRRQHEKTWLEALLLKLVASSGDGSLRELLEVVLTRKVTFPSNELSQIAFRQFSNAKVQWPLLVQILQIDPSVFLSDSVPLLERLCDSIADSSEEEYALIRDSIVIPLMRMAAQNRELQSYIHMWRRRLSEEIQEAASSPKWRGSRVWQDPNVFAAFIEIVRIHATPFFVHSLIRESLEQIMTFDTDEDNLYAALAWTAILGSVITSRAKDCAAEVDFLRQMLEATATAYASTQCPDNQGWRFLRLFRQVLTVLPDEDYAERLLPMSIDHMSYPSLGDWRKMEDPSEVKEYFHLSVCQAVVWPHKFQELLRAEFKHLAELLQTPGDRSAGLSLSGLADACLGIILQNTEVLLFTSTEALWPALWQYVTTSESTSSQRLFEAITSSDTVISNHILLSQCFQAIHESIAGNEAHRSQYAYKTLLSMPCQNIKRSQERAKLIKVLEDAGVGQVAEKKPAAASLQPENNLFHQFKSRAVSASTIDDQRGRPPVLEADSFERLCLEIDYAKLTLKTPNQYAVDDLLSILTSLSSPNAPVFESMPKNGPSAIYQRLCSLASVLLTRFRKRLGGRYHLLLPILQGLLRCLFRPVPTPASSKQPQIRHHQPPWLLHANTEPLDAKSATQYTRLLTSLCNPTASSVKHSRGASAGLTDDTKKAKSISGQYMQYLVMEYARCQLQGQLPPEVKTSLMPGLYAVLDVMPRELMRGMNAAMGSSSRAIFKGLYEDYQRFGRWNQN